MERALDVCNQLYTAGEKKEVIPPFLNVLPCYLLLPVLNITNFSLVVNPSY